MKNVITNIAKKNMVKARKGEISLPIIAGIAIGDGAENVAGEYQEPTEFDNALKHELLRRVYLSCENISDTCYRYRIELAADELVGKKINEAALYDLNGDLLAIRVFTSKEKDADMEMAFEFDDRF